MRRAAGKAYSNKKVQDGDFMNDLERKLYRIIYNMSRFRRSPPMNELKIKTGRDEQTIRKAVEVLYLEKILKGIKRKENGRSNNADPYKSVLKKT